MLLQPLLDEIILTALREDLAGGDLSVEACVDPDRRAQARALAKSPLVVAGGEVFRRVFQLVDARTEVFLDVSDGQKAGDRRCIWRASGYARSLLMAERTALNFVQRMSGTATLARACVDALPAGSSTRIIDNAKSAEATLVLVSEKREKNILSLSGGGRVSEFQLRYLMSYRMIDRNAVEIIPMTEISLKRDLSYSDTETLGKEAEEALLYRDMQNDAVQQLLRRLQLTKLNTTPATP